MFAPESLMPLWCADLKWGYTKSLIQQLKGYTLGSIKVILYLLNYKSKEILGVSWLVAKNLGSPWLIKGLCKVTMRDSKHDHSMDS